MNRMTDEITVITDATREPWYELLVDDCKAIITEAVFNSRWALVEGYHQLGERIVTENNLDRKEIYGKKILSDLTKSIRVGERVLYRAIQFYEKYPDLSTVPEGKNISWNKIVTKYLPERSETDVPELPDGKYRVIYADPPWEYEQHGVSVDRSYGSDEFQYPSMNIDDLCDLPIKNLAADDSVLFIWVTSPKLNQVWQLIEAWGFEYKTSFVWDKVQHNFGYYNSVRHELLLICGRGSSTPDVAHLFDSVQSIERSDKHSEKPIQFRQIIDTIYTQGRKIELFARKKVEGWDVWGNQV